MEILLVSAGGQGAIGLPCQVNSTTIEKNRPLRIAVISPYAHHAGHHWPAARELALALCAAGHEVDIITTVASIEAAGSELEKRVHLAWTGQPPAFLRRGTSLAHNAETMFCLWRTFQRHLSRRYDVWHLIDGTHLSVYLAAFLSRWPLVYHIWGAVSGYEPAAKGAKLGWLPRLRRAFLARALCRGNFALVCETEETRRAGATLFGNSIHQIPYAVRGNSMLMNQAEAREKLGLSAVGFVLLMFGTHREGKDYDTVVQAAKMTRSDIHLLFAGKTISDNDPARVVAKYGFSSATIVEKFITAPEAPLYFAACDAVALPYAGDYQKGSYVIFEALQFRRPSIATDTGFLRKFIEENDCGAVYRSGDAEDLARVIDTFAQLSAGEKAQLAVRIEEAAARCSWATVIQQYVQLYRSLIDRGNRLASA